MTQACMRQTTAMRAGLRLTLCKRRVARLCVSALKGLPALHWRRAHGPGGLRQTSSLHCTASHDLVLGRQELSSHCIALLA